MTIAVSDAFALCFQGYEDTAPDAVDGETVSTAHDGKSEKKEGAWEIPVRFLGENDSHPVHLVKRSCSQYPCPPPLTPSYLPPTSC